MLEGTNEVPMHSKHRMHRPTILLVVLLAAGCSTSVQQEPLYSTEDSRPLVLTGDYTGQDWYSKRNDIGRTDGRQLYYGPGGTLRYEDGSPVEFKSVKKQLQDLRTEERISP